MKLRIEELCLDDEDIVEALLSWDNDSEIFPLITPVRTPDPTPSYKTLDEYRKSLTDSKSISQIYIIFDDNKPIGSFSLQMDPPQLAKKVPGTSWLGLTIGNKSYWGSGVAQYAMEYFEAESRRRGASRIELGVFEFNHRAKRFYLKLGFQEFERLPKFTYWEGRFWDDIRMEKYL